MWKWKCKLDYCIFIFTQITHTYVENYYVVELHFYFKVYIIIWIWSPLYGSIRLHTVMYSGSECDANGKYLRIRVRRICFFQGRYWLLVIKETDNQYLEPIYICSDVSLFSQPVVSFVCCYNIHRKAWSQSSPLRNSSLHSSCAATMDVRDNSKQQQCGASRECNISQS